MIEEKIKKAVLLNPDKEAVSYRGERLSYACLAGNIAEKKAYLSSFNIFSLAIQTETLDGLITFLAAVEAGISSVIIPTDYSEEAIIRLCSEFGMTRYLNGTVQQSNGSDFSKVQPSGEIGILSSGTSGDPKIIWKTVSNWTDSFVHQSECFGIAENDRLFVLDTLAYSANLNAAIHMLWQGGSVVFGQLAEASFWPALLKQENVSSVFLVPSHARLLVRSTVTFDKITSFVTAGEKLDVETASRIMEVCPGVALTEYYGAAELGHVTYQQNADILKNPLTVGKAFPGVKIRVVAGEIKVESPYVSPDYVAEASVHDLGELQNGVLTLFGRSGRMFNRRGLNIYAAEIENKALECGFVIEAALIPVLLKKGIEKLHLYVSKKAGELQVKERLELYLLERLPKSKIPNKIIVLDELPHSDAGKIDFRALSKINEEEQVIA
jgi:long-chain acyl-CoA synthetase